jgi:hypothetical protein
VEYIKDVIVSVKFPLIVLTYIFRQFRANPLISNSSYLKQPPEGAKR